MNDVLVTATEVHALLASDDPPVLLDVRWALGDPDGYGHYRAGHLPGAVFVDLDAELAGSPRAAAGRHPLPTVEALEAAARRWGLRDGDARPVSVVAYDNSGGLAAARAWWLLRWSGVRGARLLDGGLGAWTAAGFPVEAGEAVVPARGDVTLRPGQLPVLDADDAGTLARTGVLLDARAAERYRGEVEPIDPRAGHIPGARSAPTTENLGPDGTFKTAAELRERFAELGVVGSGATGTAPVGVYCGSGVTAAHELAALAIAGIEGALYAGSWSQWSADPSRPAATEAPEVP
ncbi:sulfurtransferase [Cryptosporangium minutisporangium]|uniref:sulfurtransferase n=1 Tax=Cryptosporangium minutisporangium TaxID=113569 RepID=UPI0035E78E0C